MPNLKTESKNSSKKSRTTPKTTGATTGKCGELVEVSYRCGWGQYLAEVKTIACTRSFDHRGNHICDHETDHDGDKIEWTQNSTKTEVREH